MALVGIGLRLWAGAVVSGVQLPGGAGIQLERAEDVNALSRRLRHLELRTEVRLRRIERKIREDNGDGGTIK